jgi:hypothetical protein
MRCYCDISYGGAGKINTPYSYHLYLCEFCLDEIEGYTYEQFDIEYKKMENKTNEEIRIYFTKMIDDYSNSNLKYQN